MIGKTRSVLGYSSKKSHKLNQNECKMQNSLN